jgi:hypothetical protein
MEIRAIHSFLIHPGKNLEEPHEINGKYLEETFIPILSLWTAPVMRVRSESRDTRV